MKYQSDDRRHVVYYLQHVFKQGFVVFIGLKLLCTRSTTFVRYLLTVTDGINNYCCSL